MDLKHNTPLHFVGEHHLANFNKPIECAEILISAGADLNISNADGKTPMTNATVKQLKKNMPELLSQFIEK